MGSVITNGIFPSIGSFISQSRCCEKRCRSMVLTYLCSRNRRRFLRRLVLLVALAIVFVASAADERVPVLHVGARSYTNVVITGKTATDLFIQHAQGIATVKIADLDAATRSQLGVSVPRTSEAGPNSNPIGVQPARTDDKQGTPAASPDSSKDAWLLNLRLIKWVAIPLAVWLIGWPLLARLAKPKPAEPGAPTGPLTDESGEDIDQVLEGRRPLRSLMKHFGSAVSALTFYGNRMQQKYHTAAPPGTCVMCGKPNGTVTETYYWKAFVRPRFKFGALDAVLLFLGRVGFTVEQTVVSFVTTHQLCADCGAKARFRRGLSVAIKAAAFFCLVIGLGLTILGGAGFVYLKIRATAQAQRDAHGFALACALGIVGIVASILGHRLETLLRVPPRLRVIGRKPFLLAKVVRREGQT